MNNLGRTSAARKRIDYELPKSYMPTYDVWRDGHYCTSHNQFADAVTEAEQMADQIDAAIRKSPAYIKGARYKPGRERVEIYETRKMEWRNLYTC